jgi:hypothetical protein
LDKDFATTRKLVVSAKISANKPTQSLGKMRDHSNARQRHLVSVQSRFSANETMERLLATLAERNLTSSRVLTTLRGPPLSACLRTTELVIFGNPKGSTPLMQDQQSAGIDLPLKALVWEDPERSVWLSYNDPTWIASATRSVLAAIRQ